MYFFLDWYQRLISILDAMAEKESEKEKKKQSSCKYIFASVFPDQETMDIALKAIRDSEEQPL